VREPQEITLAAFIHCHAMNLSPCVEGIEQTGTALFALTRECCEASVHS